MDPPPALSKLKTLAKSRWMQAARSVKLSMRANRVLREGNVTSHAAAAFMVHEAWGWEKGGVELDGRPLSGTPSARRLYRMFHNFTWLRRIPITVLLILSLVELLGGVTMCTARSTPTPTGWFWFLNRNLFHLIELVCALSILVETVWMLKMQGGTNSWGDFRRMDRIFQMKFAASGALIVDNIVSWVAFTWLRMGGYLRIAIFILTIPQVRKSFYNVISIVPKFLSVAFSLCLLHRLRGWLALAALKGTGEEETYSDLWTSIRLMTVLLTTANNPDVWLGAYAQNRLWGLFFLAYVCFGNYLMSLLLATIYGVYKDQAGQTVMECERRAHGVSAGGVQPLGSGQEGVRGRGERQGFRARAQQPHGHSDGGAGTSPRADCHLRLGRRERAHQSRSCGIRGAGGTVAREIRRGAQPGAAAVGVGSRARSASL